MRSPAASSSTRHASQVAVAVAGLDETLQPAGGISAYAPAATLQQHSPLPAPLPPPFQLHSRLQLRSCPSPTIHCAAAELDGYAAVMGSTPAIERRDGLDEEDAEWWSDDATSDADVLPNDGATSREQRQESLLDAWASDTDDDSEGSSSGEDERDLAKWVAT